MAARSLDEPLLASHSVSGWREELTAVVNHWTSPRKLILALDEFQWMAESAPELPSLIQELWDRHWRARKNIFLILCGSYVGFMEREVLGKKSPLFGRRTGQIQLKPFSYREAALFHPRLSLAQKAATRVSWWAKTPSTWGGLRAGRESRIRSAGSTAGGVGGLNAVLPGDPSCQRTS